MSRLKTTFPAASTSLNEMPLGPSESLTTTFHVNAQPVDPCEIFSGTKTTFGISGRRLM